ncbi:hypothetical protein [Phyllobacterium lublinensis]|uniref:hypothetical protein n=1 Tax=Phyllobacterium lublinensis TaxID=2875708 RepID=UPI001CCD9A7A|nr:hypothetical protein [Phyllobacterium sp. 2063]MBZ9655305.1 hypothetical protein [Phyllobacterium sp. 2063]
MAIKFALKDPKAGAVDEKPAKADAQTASADPATASGEDLFDAKPAAAKRKRKK